MKKYKDKKLKVGVLMGGPSAEREVSLASGRQALSFIDKKKYEVTGIDLPKEGFNLPTNRRLRAQDVVFVCLHGPFGEDGVVQGYLESLGVRYTGSGVLASALGMDKYLSRQIFSETGLKVPQTVLVSKNDSQGEFEYELEFPCFVKPRNQGSSIGVTKVEEAVGLEKSLREAFGHGDFALVEECLEGTEVTCGVLGNANSKLQALVPTEIAYKDEFFNYEVKYTPGLAEEITPARLDKGTLEEIRRVATKVHDVLGCRGFSRTDMFVTNRGVIVLEINTIPGLTATSLLPQGAAACGIDFPSLLDKIIEFSLE